MKIATSNSKVLKVFTFLCLIMLLSACSGDDNGSGDGDIDPIGDNQDPITGVQLVFPFEDSLCNEGTDVTPTESTVFFEWEPNNSTGAAATSLNQHPLVWSKIFPVANHSLHSLDWIALMGSEDEEEELHRNELFRYGAGLDGNKTMIHARASGTPKESLLSDPDYLRKLNSLDYKLWEEAKKLNRLDLISIQRMKPYYDDAVAAAKATKPDKGTYPKIAADLGVSEGNVRVMVNRIRKRYRSLLRESIAETVSSDEEITDELNHLFAAFARE